MTDRASFLATRRERLAARLSELGLDAYITFSPANRHYLTGFTGSFGYALITRDGAEEFFTDWRYLDQAAAECPTFKINTLTADKSLWSPLAPRLKELGVQRLGFEGGIAPADFAVQARENVPVEWVSAGRLVEGLRAIKDDFEIDRLRGSLRIAEEVFDHILPFIKPGVSERELAVEMRHQIELRGANNYPNMPIVASGWRAALPHGRASDKIVADGEFVLFDFGALLDGYHSDMTRTVVCGRAGEREREIYDLVRLCHDAGQALMKEGVTGQAVDRAARQPIIEAGYGDSSHGYSVGHGLGLEVHEDPFVSEGYTDTLKSGMVITMEPGVYIQGWGGVRIENTVLVTPEGPDAFNTTTRELLEV